MSTDESKQRAHRVDYGTKNGSLVKPNLGSVEIGTTCSWNEYLVCFSDLFLGHPIKEIASGNFSADLTQRLRTGDIHDPDPRFFFSSLLGRCLSTQVKRQGEC